MDNAFKVRTFKEVITDKNNFKEPGAVLGRRIFGYRGCS